MTSEHDAAYERTLTSNLSRVIDFLKYGEAKNAALLTFASAWLGGSGSAIIGADPSRSSRMTVAMLCIAAVTFFLGAGCAIAALLPFTKVQDVIAHPRRTIRHLLLASPPPARLNPLFFGHIREFSDTALRGELSRRYRPVGRRLMTADYEADLCSQTLINSHIALRKFRLFNGGVICVLVGLVFVVLALAASAIRVFIEAP